jgi:hypothetical protein
MTEKPLPGHDQQPEDIICSSCGRFVGALSRCPHCGARVHKRMSVRFFRMGALLLGTAGLFLLYLMAVNKEIPVIQIDEIEPTMNFAYVRIVGHVTGDCRIYRKGDRIQSLRFYVSDETGEITVTAYRAVAENLLAENKVPRLGDEVDVAGGLSVSDERVMLRLQVPEQLSIDRPDLPVTPIGEIRMDMEPASVIVEGVIAQVRAPRADSRAPWTVVVQDESGTAPVSFWQDTYQAMTDKAKLKAGMPVRLRAGIGAYQSKLQLRLANPMDIEFTGEAGDVPEPVEEQGRAGVESVMLDEITPDRKGDILETEGQVTRIYRPSSDKAPYRLTLKDGQAVGTVIFWEGTAQRLPEGAMQKGARIQAQGMVDAFKDKAQLKVNRGYHIKVLKKAESAEPLPAGEERRISELTPEMKGEVCTLTGTLGDARTIRGGTIYRLKQGDEAIDVVIWHRNVTPALLEGLQPGLDVRISGKVDLYQENVQLVPRNSQDIRIRQTGGGAS